MLNICTQGVKYVSVSIKTFSKLNYEHMVKTLKHKINRGLSEGVIHNQCSYQLDFGWIIYNCTLILYLVYKLTKFDQKNVVS